MALGESWDYHDDPDRMDNYRRRAADAHGPANVTWMIRWTDRAERQAASKTSVDQSA